jgi:hypothetical protein
LSSIACETEAAASQTPSICPPIASVSAGAAAIADQRHLDPRRLDKTLADQKIRGADAGMAEIDLAGVAFGVGDEFLQVFGRKILAQRHDAEGLCHHSDGRERVGLERQHRIDRVGGGIGAGVADRDGVAVRLGTRGPRQRGRAAGAGDILDHDRLPERRTHLLGDGARDHVRGAAGRKWHDHGDRVFRIILGKRGA